MNKTLIVLLLVFFPFTLFSQELTVELIDQKETVSPGKTHTLVFKIANPNPYPTTVISDLKLPAKWTLITSIESITLQPNETRIALATIDIPSFCPKGIHDIRLQCTDVARNQSRDYSFQLNVSPVQKLSLSTLNVASFVKAGDTISSLFLLKNEGNDREVVQLETSLGSEIVGANTLEILPGSSEIVRVDQKTDRKASAFFQNIIKLTASTATDTVPNKYTYARTDVIPLFPIADDVWLRFPIKISGIYMAQGPTNSSQDGFQGEIYGKGSINELNTRFVEFRAIGPDRLGITSYTQYEEYFFQYNSANLFAHIGDKIFASSYLTEFSRYGRGVELRAKINRFEIGGFYTKPRFFKEIKDEINVYTKWNITSNSNIRYGYLLKRMEERHKKIQENHLHYLTAETNLFSIIDLEGEYAVSNNAVKQGNAWQLQARTRYRKFNANLNYINASSDFTGYFSGTRFFTTHVLYRILPQLMISGNYQKDARNFERDTLYSAAPYRENLQLALNYTYLKKGTISLSAGIQEYEDRMKVKQFFYREKFGRIEWSQEMGYFGLNLQVYLGRTTNFLTQSTGNSTVYTTNLSFNKQRTSFNVYGSYSVVNRYQTADQKVFLFGGSINSFITNKINARVFYQNSYYLENYFSDRNLFELSLNYALSPKHEITLISRYALAQNQLEDKDFSFSAKYTLYWNAPLKKIKEYGYLKGNSANLGRASTSGIKLYLGPYVAITDEKGDFSFENIKPGIYFLEIDKETIGLDDIADVNMPVRIDITEGENNFYFGMTKASSIQGAFLFDRDRVDDASTAPNTESVIVEVLSENQVYRKVVKLSKPFEFTYLRPGDWQVNVYRNGLAKQYKIKTNSFSFTLQPLEKKTIVVELTKQEREIKFLQDPIKVGYNTKSNKKNEK